MATFVSSGAWGAVKKRRGRYPSVEKEQRTYQGIVFGSRIEMVRGAELMALQRAGKIKDLQFQPEYEVYFHDQLLCTYTADSYYVDIKTGTPIVEEVKSKITRLDQYYRLRRKAAEIYHNIEVTEVVR